MCVKVSPAGAGVPGVCHSHGAHQPLDRCTMLSAPTAVKMLLLSYRNLIMQSNDIEQNTPISTISYMQCNTVCLNPNFNAIQRINH